ncbi:glycosyltransferase [Methylobacterium sp. J-030]|uniref:glycosyltransferase family 2 protein n=1 Tax=Methylobacterium sp. J-030 TaxID=2836627 RepID=UPI001FBC067B|nr:glycosyltransferase [Methylobacterium sp. J-030]MCJ2071061.1 glycosyltransferase [Methylobacterium sp. J-030]
MRPKISVCIPSFSHGKYIGRCIESVLQQTIQDFELVISDDNSQDETVQIIESYADDRIRIIKNTINAGPNENTNRCLRAACGEYVALLASDDVMLPRRLAAQLSVLEKKPELGAVFSLIEVIDDTDAVLSDTIYEEIFTHENRPRLSWLRHFFLYGNCLAGITPMIRRRVIDEIGLYHPLLVQLADFDYWIRICTRWEIEVLPEKLCRYRIHQAGTNTSADTVDSRVRLRWESAYVFRHYECLAAADLRIIFPEVNTLPTDAPNYLLLLEACIKSPNIWAKMYGLTIFVQRFPQPEAAQHFHHAGYNWRTFANMLSDADPFGMREAENLLEKLNRAERVIDSNSSEQFPSDNHYDVGLPLPRRGWSALFSFSSKTKS